MNREPLSNAPPNDRQMSWYIVARHIRLYETKIRINGSHSGGSIVPVPGVYPSISQNWTYIGTSVSWPVASPKLVLMDTNKQQIDAGEEISLHWPRFHKRNGYVVRLLDSSLLSLPLTERYFDEVLSPGIAVPISIRHTLSDPTEGTLSAPYHVANLNVDAKSSNKNLKSEMSHSGFEPKVSNRKLNKVVTPRVYITLDFCL
ncbi:unnamed protein product [Colias eurytheme]|nr:unnamed protein product [Colias eurytheme]